MSRVRGETWKRGPVLTANLDLNLWKDFIILVGVSNIDYKYTAQVLIKVEHGLLIGRAWSFHESRIAFCGINNN